MKPNVKRQTMQVGGSGEGSKIKREASRREQSNEGGWGVKGCVCVCVCGGEGGYICARDYVFRV